MKTINGKLAGFLIISMLLLNFSESKAQTIIEFSGGGGYSIMDAEGWYDGPGEVDDWNQSMWQVYTQIYPYMFAGGKIGVGAEFGYQKYLWYEIKEKDFWTGQKRKIKDETEGDFRLLVLFRGYIAGGFFGEFGLGTYDFENFGLEGTLGYDIKLSRVMYIPIKARFDFTLDETYGNTFAPGLTLGFAFRIGGD